MIDYKYIPTIKQYIQDKNEVMNSRHSYNGLKVLTTPLQNCSTTVKHNINQTNNRCKPNDRMFSTYSKINNDPEFYKSKNIWRKLGIDYISMKYVRKLKSNRTVWKTTTSKHRYMLCPIAAMDYNSRPATHYYVSKPCVGGRVITLFDKSNKVIGRDKFITTKHGGFVISTNKNKMIYHYVSDIEDFRTYTNGDRYAPLFMIKQLLLTQCNSVNVTEFFEKHNVNEDALLHDDDLYLEFLLTYK